MATAASSQLASSWTVNVWVLGSHSPPIPWASTTHFLDLSSHASSGHFPDARTTFLARLLMPSITQAESLHRTFLTQSSSHFFAGGPPFPARGQLVTAT